MGTIRGANGGYPFYFYLGDEIDPGEIDPAYAYRWSNTADDYGIHILVASISVVGRWFDGDFLVDTSTPFKALFVLFLLTAVILLSPNIPLPISVGGLLAFSVAIFLGPIDLSTSSQGWGVTYMVLLVGIGLAASAHLKKNLTSALFLLLLSLLVGFTQFLRQESIASVYAAGLGMLGMAWLITGVSYRMNHDMWRTTILPFAVRISAAALAMLLGVFAAPYGLKAVYSWAWEIPYSETVVTQHGAGLPLYVGTGYVSNPYNIAWLDPIGEIHAQLYKPGVSIHHGNKDFQHTLQTAWRQVITESPWLLLENAYHKAKFMDSFLRNGKTPYPSAFLYASQSGTMRLLYYLSWGMMLTAPFFIIYRKSVYGLYMYGSLVMMTLGACVGPISGFPSYIPGPQGSVLVIIFMVPPALWYSGLLPSDSRLLQRILGIIGAFAVIVVVLMAAGIYIQWQAFQKRIQDIENADPMAEIQRQEFRYGHYFNMLSAEKQAAIIDRLLQTGDKRIFSPSAIESGGGFFSPRAAILSENQLHVIVWLGEGFPGPVHYMNQARVYSLVQVCADCETLAQTYTYTDDAVVYTFLNDTDWNNQYRFLSFPVDVIAFLNSGYLRVGVQRLLDWGGGATGFGYQVEDLTSFEMK